MGRKFRWTIKGKAVAKPPGWPQEVRWPLQSSGRLCDAEIPFVLKWADRLLLAARALGATSVEGKKAQGQASAQVESRIKLQQLGRTGKPQLGNDLLVTIALEVLACDASFQNNAPAIR